MHCCIIWSSFICSQLRAQCSQASAHAPQVVACMSEPRSMKSALVAHICAQSASSRMWSAAACRPPFWRQCCIVRTQTWSLDPGQRFGSNWCDYVPEVEREAGRVPHYLPGTNPYLSEFAEWYGIPVEATRGGAQTMYPEYRKTLKQTFSTLDRCERYCTCFNGLGGCGLR